MFDANVQSIDFRLIGIADLLKAEQLAVPPYQRHYSWHVQVDEHVPDYWRDLERAFSSAGEYFLGTVVLADEGSGGRRTIIDGQQRLATTSLFLAAVRDALSDLGSSKASVVESDFLAKETMESSGKERHLQLNDDDDEFFGSIVENGTLISPAKLLPSHVLLRSAYEYFTARVGELVAAGGEGSLKQWVDFLRKRARVGCIIVPTQAEAYVIFETLNDRGADLTPADLLKNYLYGRAGDKLPVVQQHWAQALGALDLAAADSQFMTFLRHYWSSNNGLTRERDLYSAIKRSLTTKTSVVAFGKDLSAEAASYAAISNPNHDRWARLGSAPRTDVEVLARLNLLPNRPLILAAMEKFSDTEMRKLLRALVSWSVRATVLGTINSGKVEEAYCSVAVSIRKDVVDTCAAARKALLPVIPTDADFRDAFAIVRVTKAPSARYYLRVLERQLMKTPEPELVPNADENEVNLEHVLPKNARPSEWTDISSVEDVSTWAHRLGNMVLLSKGPNKKLGNKPFLTKKPVLEASELKLTSKVGKMADWTPDDITARQSELAKLAVKAWPR